MPRGSTKVRLLILETDEPHPRIQKDRGGYADILDNHFNRAAAAHDPPLELETDMRFVVEDKEGGQVPKAEEFKGFDGVLITGSMYDAHTEGGWVEKLLDTLKGESQRLPHRLVVLGYHENGGTLTISRGLAGST